MQIAPKRDSHPTALASTQLKDIRKALPLRVLSADDWRHWITKGHVIVRQAVPAANVERLVDLLWRFDEKDPDDPSTWYAPQRREHKMKELNNTGMLEIYNHQYLWDNRMEQRVYDAFVDIWDREDLWVAIDRANLNPPRRVKGNPGGFIHWDVDTSMRPLPIGVQGVLSLKRQDGDVGGFQCVPELFEHFDEWVKTQPADRDPMHPDTAGLKVVNVEMEAGDLLIFNSLLAHGVGRTMPRAASAWRSISRCIRRTSTTKPSATSASAFGASATIRNATPFPATRATGRRRMPASPSSRARREAARPKALGLSIRFPSGCRGRPGLWPRCSSLPMFHTMAANTNAAPNSVSFAGTSLKKMNTQSGAIGNSAELSRAACADGSSRAPIVKTPSPPPWVMMPKRPSNAMSPVGIANGIGKEEGEGQPPAGRPTPPIRASACRGSAV